MNLEPIDTSTTAGKARVMQLASEGRKVATRYASDRKPWSPVKEGEQPLWNWGNYDYAIIAEPVGPEEVWVLFDGDGSILVCSTCDHPDKKQKRVKFIRVDLAGRDE